MSLPVEPQERTFREHLHEPDSRSEMIYYG